ncbi:NUDIX hydrolase [Planomicrobium sp. CPCC 101079]|uniref:NUDIX hydrolase n=1 Tax=Planomicrobium sp. CPCC 101079 TaxID=2599618 RepID=UPI0011B733DE|nr:NUDIX hydrolase [Planomicrobium sp. CPCC 101079]TWT02527.1 NUDIX hydrolase [Planomicrobium sp. CPCC 101079]
MEKWLGAAGICLNDKNELLMVLEGRLEGAGKWSVPTGGLADKETFEECAVREVREETGYKVEVVEKLKVKSGVYEDIQIAYEVHYFSMKIIGGKAQIQDPDRLIMDIAWKAQAEIRSLDLNYPEDREYLLARF